LNVNLDLGEIGRERVKSCTSSPHSSNEKEKGRGPYIHTRKETIRRRKKSGYGLGQAALNGLKVPKWLIS